MHKTLKGIVEFEGPDGSRSIDNLLKETIAKATFELDKPWCISVFTDNSGIIAYDQDHGVCLKVETHNHPSAIDPYGGAGTGDPASYQMVPTEQYLPRYVFVTGVGYDLNYVQVTRPLGGADVFVDGVLVTGYYQVSMQVTVTKASHYCHK